MRALLLCMAASIVALALVSPVLPRLEKQVLPPRAAGETADVWDVLGRELRSTLAAATLLSVEQIRHRGVYYLPNEEPTPPALHTEEAAILASLRPSDMPRPENESWAVHSHYGDLFTHIHAFGARKHKHNVETEALHEHPDEHLSHTHLTDPDIPHWHEEGAWADRVEHRHGTLVHAHRLGIWPHTHPGMETMPFELIHDQDKAKLAKMQAATSRSDPASAFSVVSAVQPKAGGEHEAEATGPEHGAHEELECSHGGPLVLAKEKDWRGIFGDLEREIEPYSTTHEHPDATGALSTLPWYRIGVTIDPHFIEGWNLGAAALRRDYGQIDPAIAFIKEGLAKNPGNPELLVLLGRAYLFSKRDINAAAAALAEAARAAKAGLAEHRYANQFEAKRWETAWLDSLRMLATLYSRQGDAARARATAEAGLADFPDDGILQEMRDELLLKATPVEPR